MHNTVNETEIKFLCTAKALAAIWSKDPSSKVAAVVVGNTRNQVAFGYNGLPPGLMDTPVRLNDRDLKYKLTLHAEVNALHNARFPVRAMYVTHCPCAHCALHILATRSVRRVVYVRNAEMEMRWAESVALAHEVLAEGGVELVGVEL